MADDPRLYAVILGAGVLLLVSMLTLKAGATLDDVVLLVVAALMLWSAR